MLSFSKRSLTAVAGVVWLLVGLGLFIKGINLLSMAVQATEKRGPLIEYFEALFSGAVMPGVIFLVGMGLLVGWMKGRFLLIKSVHRTVQRLSGLKGLIPLFKLYRLQDCLLVAVMIGLGKLMQWIHCPNDLRGLINIAVGSALVSGATLYFRFAIKEKAEKAL